MNMNAYSLVALRATARIIIMQNRMLTQFFFPKCKEGDPLFIGFFHTGAYQESIGGFGGIQHCLIPAPKHVIIDIDEDGEYFTKVICKRTKS